ncbi:MAG TPA: hypothetical protein PK370_03150 [Candidatus Woesebacteria bacterium]|nr:hypothetical protein [Candidatus Woesebacteria bacterium]HPJ16726.1 hypothetical protein [Candidatus Woesebacteria bacterium]
MKKIILFLVALTILFKSDALAVVDLKPIDPNIEVIKLITPTPTPTTGLKLYITPRISIKPLITSTPTTAPTATLTPTSSPTSTPSVNPSTTVAPTQTPAVVTSIVTATPTSAEVTSTTKPDNSQMTVWFLLITIGLLAVIIFVQALPKKDNQDEE